MKHWPTVRMCLAAVGAGGLFGFALWYGLRLTGWR
jgi:hypothetical protein